MAKFHYLTRQNSVVGGPGFVKIMSPITMQQVLEGRSQ
jgi:hypothetical protein